MKNIIKLGVILMIYAGIAGLCLGWIYTKTKPKIDAQAKQEREMAIKQVMPSSAQVFEDITLADGMNVTIGYADESKAQPLGYAAIAVGGGFSSNIQTMVGFTTEFEVNAIKVFYQSETPGLGTHIEDEWFQLQFAAKTILDMVVDKDGGPLKSITGATISSRAIANSIKDLIGKLEGQPELTAPQRPTHPVTDDTTGHKPGML